MSPGEAADSIGWGPLVSMALAAAASLLGYGASNQRSKQTDAALDEVKKDHGSAIKEVRATADQVRQDLAAYREAAREKFVLVTDLSKVEERLSNQIQASHADTTKKVEELRVEFGKKGIEHTIKNTITTSMAAAILEAKKRDAL